MAVAPDGSPVELYLHLPGDDEAELIASTLAPRATILELGSGAGRVTNELAARGFVVVAVDESAEMLAHVRGAEIVRSRIESLRLDRSFDCVVLASHFVNVADDQERAALLATAAQHVAPDGVVLIEAYPPGLEWKIGPPRRVGPVELRLADLTLEGRRVRATMEYRVGESTWQQEFEAVLLDDDELVAALEENALRFDRWLDRERGWLAARPT